jgi:hypothetical protein
LRVQIPPGILLSVTARSSVHKRTEGVAWKGRVQDRPGRKFSETGFAEVNIPQGLKPRSLSQYSTPGDRDAFRDQRLVDRNPATGISVARPIPFGGNVRSVLRRVRVAPNWCSRGSVFGACLRSWLLFYGGAFPRQPPTASCQRANRTVPGISPFASNVYRNHHSFNYAGKPTC